MLTSSTVNAYNLRSPTPAPPAGDGRDGLQHQRRERALRHPRQPLRPRPRPGGSSSGSVVAVAASLADFALGTNTGGSVRVPAAYCGIFDLRPSHGVVSAENVVPMALMFDTVGWFARDLATLSRVSDVLMPPVSTDTADAELQQLSHVIIPADCFRILGSSDDDHTYEILNACAAKVFGGPDSE